MTQHPEGGEDVPSAMLSRRRPRSATFATRFRALRERDGLSQQQLATKLHISLSSVRNWEAGRREPSPLLLPRLYRVLRCSHSDLFGK